MKILIIEDEQSVSSFIRKGLEEQGFEVTQAFDGPTGLRAVAQNRFDLIILDLILPGMNGLAVCKKLREEGETAVPILMLTALGATEDVVTGLDAGADDYLAKPFKFKELLARVRALTRRKNISSATKQLQVADLEIDLDSKMVSRGEKTIKLTAKEFNLLEYLIRNKGRVVSRVDILENVWEVNFDMGTNIIDVYVNYLRNKIDKNFSPKLIHTVVGMGYVLKESYDENS
jgi:two-component system copper resistance phosphate regulon response regulator CusR